jgi:uncharacterized phage-associated protein
VNFSLSNSQQLSENSVQAWVFDRWIARTRTGSKQRGSTHIASSKFFSAMALLPSALSASAMMSLKLERVLRVFFNV